MTLSGAPANPASVLAFELKLLTQHGQSPDLASTPLSEGSRRIAERLIQGTWEELTRLRPSAGQVRELSQFLHDFLVYHLGRLANGREAAIAPG